MFSKFRDLHRGLIESHRLAAPASTLLFATLFAVALGMVTRVTFAKPPSPADEVSITASVSPGGLIEVAVPGRAKDRLAAYLPGLTQVRIPLVYDPDTRQHMGEIPVPETAPNRGYCTLRIVNSVPTETDRRVRLKPVIPEDGS